MFSWVEPAYSGGLGGGGGGGGPKAPFDPISNLHACVGGVIPFCPTQKSTASPTKSPAKAKKRKTKKQAAPKRQKVKKAKR